MGSVWIWIRAVRCRSFEVTAPHVAHREFMQQGHSKLICIPEPTKQRASMQAACVAAREPCLVMGHRGLGGWRPPRPLSPLDGPFASFWSNLSVKKGFSKGILGWEPPFRFTSGIRRSLCWLLKRPLGGQDPVADWRAPLGTRWARKTESFSSGMPAALDRQPAM